MVRLKTYSLIFSVMFTILPVGEFPQTLGNQYVQICLLKERITQASQGLNQPTQRIRTRPDRSEFFAMGFPQRRSTRCNIKFVKCQEPAESAASPPSNFLTSAKSIAFLSLTTTTTTLEFSCPARDKTTIMADTAVVDPPHATIPSPAPAAGAEADEQPTHTNDENALTTQPSETAVTEADGTQKKKKIIRRKRRPARPQVDPATVKSEPPPQTGTVFNIWYNKWSGGDREDKYLSKQAASSRCNVAKDSGYTRADKVPGSFFCLFFARGVCPKGHECEYLHRLPTLHDLFNPNVDCFGRDKFSDYRDDMGGVGSFMRQNRTLYVGRIHVTDDIEEVVARHFAEWGQVERTRVLTSRGVAFVTYTNEANAQFAKEAMAHQSLDHSEILNVRWATVDPNPLAQKREARRLEEQAAEAVRRALPAEFVAELEGRDPEARKRKKIEGSFGLQGYEPPDEIWYTRTKELEDAKQTGQGQLEAPEQPLMLESAPPAAAASAEPQNSGIFSGSTVAALQGLAGGNVTTQRTSQTAGPLVGYGSDDESD